MLRLQTYFMLGLDTPNLVWNALIHAWPWQTQMKQDAEASGFQLSQVERVSPTFPNSVEYQRENVCRVFCTLENGFMVYDVLVDNWTRRVTHRWEFEFGLRCSFFDLVLEKVSFKAGYLAYRNKSL